MKTFLIQSRNINNYEIPAHDFCYSIIEAIEYKNWWNKNNEYSFMLCEKISTEVMEDLFFKGARNYIPVGSVDFCLDYYKKCGIENIKPLNIPKELWKFVYRGICISDGENVKGHWFLKSQEQIKANINGGYYFPQNPGYDECFLTKYIDKIVSEWRLFVYNKEILGLKCYSGDEWVLPDKEYCKKVVDFYDKRCYTLDVMIYEEFDCYKKEKILITDIVELHDFFSCGLYGFNHPKLLNMTITSHDEILNAKIKFGE